MGDNRKAKRHRWRLPCELVFDGGRQRAFVLDLSQTGLFVRTGARLRPGSTVEVRIRFEDGDVPVVMEARVARSKQVPAHLTNVAQGGVGLALRDVPKQYLDALAKLEAGGALRAEVTRDAPRTRTLAAATAARFRVRVQQHDGPRSRTIEVLAGDAEQARASALLEAGPGWDVARVEKLAS